MVLSLLLHAVQSLSIPCLSVILLEYGLAWREIQTHQENESLHAVPISSVDTAKTMVLV